MTARCRIAVLVLLALAGCWGDSGPSTPIAPQNVSPGGLWQGTDSLTGLQVAGLVTETGEFHFIRSDDTQYVGTLTVKGVAASGDCDGFSALGTAWPDGSTHGTGTVSATIEPRGSITATVHFTTDAGTQSTSTLTLAFNTLYNRPSSLATFAGNFTEAATGVVFSVSAAGAVFAQDPKTGCVVNGTISIINPSYNAYGVSAAFETCTGTFAALNGVTLTGLAMLDNTVTPERAVVGLTAQSGSTKVAIVETLSRN